MSAIKLSTPSSGSISLSPANTASNLTITVPAVSATLATLTTPSFASTIGVGGATASASGAGITFPATQSASTDANTLDDYEEGTFTPTVIGGVTSPNYVRQSGTYTKIGNLVQFQISLQTGGGGTLNGNPLIIGGLPFVLASYAGGVGFSYAYANSGFINSTSTNLPTLYGDEISQNLSFYQTTGASFVGTNLTSVAFRVDITGTYRV